MEFSSTGCATAFDGIRDLVREFIWTNFPVPKGGLVLGEECPRQYIHTPRTASKAFDVSSWKIEQRLVQLGFADRPVGARRPVMQDYPDVELIQRVVRDIRGLWSAKKAKDFLGIEAATLLLLVKAGWLTVEMKLGTKAPYYNGEKITAFLQRFRTQCIARNPHVDDAAPLSRIANRCQSSLEEILRVVFEERLPLVADDPETAQFHDFRVSLADVREVAATNNDAVCTLSEAADLMSTDTKTVRALISCGHLSTVSPFSKRRHQRWHIVSKASITEFNKQFISLRALSKVQGKTPGPLSLQLAKDAVSPLALRAKTQRIFRRCDVL